MANKLDVSEILNHVDGLFFTVSPCAMPVLRANPALGMTRNAIAWLCPYYPQRLKQACHFWVFVAGSRK